jgi:hypothetical protein
MTPKGMSAGDMWRAGYVLDEDAIRAQKRDTLAAYVLESEGVSLVVEKQGRTDCRECAWGEPTESAWDDGREWQPVLYCSHDRAMVYGTGPEYCGDFVEAIL